MFEKQLAYGQVGESRIAQWFRRRGFSVLPVYEKEIDNGKGPRLFLPIGKLIAPDMLIFRADDCYWIEAKHKTAFSWYRKKERWVTGIDLRHYTDYLKINEFSKWPVWLLFLHDGGVAKDSPPDSPAGLFGGDIKYLSKNESHRSDRWGISGMVYWAHSTLKLMANISDI